VTLREEQLLAPGTRDPLVSVIIPVYQGERIIAGAVRSALNQTHRNVQVIVIDDGSTDGTREVLEALDDPRVLVLAQTNSGTAAARNLGLAHARGAYIAFLDSDDRWLPEKLATEIATLRTASDPIAMAYSSYFAVDDQGRLLNLARQRTSSGDVLDELLDGEDYLMPSLCLFDRRIFDEVGTFNVGRYHEDHEFILRVTRRFPIVATGKRLAVYRQSTSGKCRAILADFDRARTEELSLLGDLTDVLTREQIARLRANVLRSLYCRFLMYGFHDYARRIAGEVDMRALRTSKKGLLAFVFAKTGINLLLIARTSIQTYYLAARQGWWARLLTNLGLELRYD
jgi:glycosyltransferase involved in cell wall biosynthesis